MALSFVSMGQGAIGTSVTTFYTNSSGGKANLTTCRVLNTTAVGTSMKVWLDQDGTAATDAELFFGKDILVPANGSVEFSGQEYVGNGGALKAQAALAGLVLRASGYEGVT